CVRPCSSMRWFDMSTVMLCPKCGGTVGAVVPGKSQCTCSPRANGGAAPGSKTALKSKATAAAVSSGGATNGGGTVTKTGSVVLAMDSDGSAYGNDVTNTTAARPGEKKKICCKCGADVTHAKRMKDGATGRYWCYECGT